MSAIPVSPRCPLSRSSRLSSHPSWRKLNFEMARPTRTDRLYPSRLLFFFPSPLFSLSNSRPPKLPAPSSSAEPSSLPPALPSSLPALFLSLCLTLVLDSSPALPAALRQHSGGRGQPEHVHHVQRQPAVP
jgi:hypothetical protein